MSLSHSFTLSPYLSLTESQTWVLSQCTSVIKCDVTMIMKYQYQEWTLRASSTFKNQQDQTDSTRSISINKHQHTIQFIHIRLQLIHARVFTISHTVRFTFLSSVQLSFCSRLPRLRTRVVDTVDRCWDLVQIRIVITDSYRQLQYTVYSILCNSQLLISYDFFIHTCAICADCCPVGVCQRQQRS